MKNEEMKFTLGDIMPERYKKIGTTNKNRRNKVRRRERKREYREQHQPESAMDVIKHLSENRKKAKK